MNRLYTKEGLALPSVPWEYYPRPQFKRADWLCLNGSWQLSIIKSGTEAPAGEILVPFCAESLLSKVATPPAIGERFICTRSFTIPKNWAGRRILLHFGAVMRDCTVKLNGQTLMHHDNGYLPFTVDITHALHSRANVPLTAVDSSPQTTSTALLSGTNVLRVEIQNDLDTRFPWGKQSRKRGGMWYTPCSGIWQTVWLEPVPEEYVKNIEISNGCDWVEIRAKGIGRYPGEGCIELEGKTYALHNGTVRIHIDDPKLWSPEAPHLYEFTLKAGDDCVSSYFALRTLSVKNFNGIPRLCLNGKPYFFNALLDQGYYSDGLYTPAAPELYTKDILAMKDLGFNTLRKHIKIEPEAFYYDCDRLGMLVFQDMVNNGEYSYLRDTVLPTIHLQKRRDKRLHRDAQARLQFLEAMDATVRLLNNHPCICLWTIFNEGWGQFDADEAYRRLKALDPTRFIDSTSGWFHQKLSDVDSLHIYFDALHLGKEKKPQLLSEYGGYVWKLPEHSFNTQKTYGYKKFEKKEDFVKELRALFQSMIPLARQGLCGAVYTQLSDVEDETNGIFTFDRAQLKLQRKDLIDIIQKINEAMN